MALKLYPIVQQRLNNDIANEIIPEPFGKTNFDKTATRSLLLWHLF